MSPPFLSFFELVRPMHYPYQDFQSGFQDSGPAGKGNPSRKKELNENINPSASQKGAGMDADKSLATKF